VGVSLGWDPSARPLIVFYEQSEIKNRKAFFFTKDKIPDLNNWVVKSSSSLSGVLHIGRLSDLIRGEAVSRALEKEGFKQEFIYVTEDMDPLRKIPKEIPKKFEEYLGMPVSDVPDPFGCHDSYAEHFVSSFFDVLDDFLFLKPTVFSMRKEYKKGSFNKSAEILLENSEQVRAIIESKQDSKLAKQWSPWKPICEKCGKLQTTVLTKIDGLNLEYKCQDYSFEKTIAKGCGFEGKADLSKGNGKLVWKSEWAAQWQHWGVCSEGAGKEYESKNSAFWVNAEICEKVLHFPMPVPIFYEHLMIDGKKMSASLGNVVYPVDWAEVARPETLKYLYMKRINKARSFNWAEVPTLELELDRAIRSDSKLVLYSNIKNRELAAGILDYGTIAALTPLFNKDKDLLEALFKAGLLPKEMGKTQKATLDERIKKARIWTEKYAPPEFRLSFLEKVGETETEAMDGSARELLPKVAEALKSINSADEMQQLIFETAKANNVHPKQLFKAIYLALTGKDFGPRAGLLIFALGKDRCISRLKEAKA